ncbi:hypothetical protein PO909_008336 [Leuciscus waleckii]
MDNLTFRHSILLMEGLKVTPQSSYPVFILLFLAYVFTMVSNFGLIVLISTEKNLHNPMHFLFCNLPLNDMLGTTVILPRLMQDILQETSERYITYMQCVTQAYFVHVFIAACLTVRLSHCRSKIENPFCDNASLFKLSCESVVINNIYGIVYTVAVLCFSAVPIFITYVKIAVVSIKTCSTHLAVYLVMFFSGAIMTFLHRFPEYSDSRKLTSIMFHILPPGLNPLVYGLQTKEIRQKVAKLWWRKKVISL